MMHSGIPPGAAHSSMSAVRAMHGHRAAPAVHVPVPVPVPVTAGAAVAWPPLMVIHGSVDRVVSGTNGQAAVQVWADGVGARAAPPRAVQRGKRYPMTVTDYKLGRKLIATHVEVGKLGHAWSGGAARHAYSDGQGPDASRMMWAFAAKQFGG